MLTQNLLTDITKRLTYYKSLGDKTFEQLDNNEAFTYQPNEESNSIAIIVQHMAGNMLSRFTNFLTEDGEKEWRNRDKEFETVLENKEAVISAWNKGWDCLLTTLVALKPTDLEKEITIRSEKLFVYDALLRQLAHYPYHIGQIIYLAKIVKNNSWKSLSIPKGNSNAFNKEMKINPTAEGGAKM